MMFCLLNEQCFHRVGVGVDVAQLGIFFCYGTDGHRDPQLSTTPESVGILVGDCGLFHSVIPHCDSVVSRGFPSGFTAAPQFFGVDFFLFRDPQKKAQKERFGSDCSGACFSGFSTQCTTGRCLGQQAWQTHWHRNLKRRQIEFEGGIGQKPCACKKFDRTKSR